MESLLPTLLVILFYGFFFVALIYFIVQRIHAKNNEKFENRDN